MKNSLVLLNLGLLVIVFSATGRNMIVNYFSLTTGIFLVLVGIIGIVRKRREKAKA